MSNILWYPETIKASVLTDVLNWKTIEKSYEDLCERFRQKMIPESDHQSLFESFVKETSNLANAQTNIKEIMFNESIYPRYRILQYVVSKLPINTSYNKLCETIGDISYPEFEFWYYQFYNGQRDLDYDRSKEPKPITFFDLPIDVIEKIVKLSDIRERYILRGVSRSTQSVVDSSILRIREVLIIANNHWIHFFLVDVKGKFIRSFRLMFKNLLSQTPKTIFHNPKLQLESLDLQLYDNGNRNIVEMFESLSHQLHVRSLKITGSTQQDLFDVILRMKPKILKKLEFDCHLRANRIIYDITNSEQWKQVEEVIVNNPITCNITHFSHFKSFDICLRPDFMDNILELRNAIPDFTNFEWCRLRIRYTPFFRFNWPSDAEIQRDLGLKKHVHDNMKYFVFNIPNSTETLVFSFLSFQIFIKRSTCFAGL